MPSPTPSPSPATVQSGQGRWLFMGDIFFGRYINDWSMDSSLKYAYPFQKLGQFHPDDYTDWVANFECPAVAGVHTSSAQMDATLKFNCDPRYLPEVAKWYTAVSLGNNHSGDQGTKGVTETPQNLADNDIQYFGAGDPASDDNCNVITLSVKTTLSDGSATTVPIPFGFCGYDGVYAMPTKAQIGQITDYSELLPTIAWPHSGTEYRAAPDSIKKKLYRDMADAGADMVVGNHAHWVQPTEAYDGKLIVYSLGNFIFDQQAGPEKTRSALLDVSFTVENPEALDGWSAIAAQCQNDFDRCQDLAAQNDLPKLRLSYQFDVQGSDDSGKLVKKATSRQLKAIKDRLHWQDTMDALARD